MLGLEDLGVKMTEVVPALVDVHSSKGNSSKGNRMLWDDLVSKVHGEGLLLSRR